VLLSIPSIRSEIGLREELFARVSETEAPPHFPGHPVQKWLYASALQKSIRRGHTHCAIRFAIQLHSLDEQYAWRRLAVIALEDIGFGDPLAVALTLEANRSHRFRQQLGERWVLATIVTSLAEAVKSRALCDALVIRGQGHQPPRSKAFKAHTAIHEAPWLVRYLATRGFGHADLGKFVLPVWELLKQSNVTVQTHEPDDLGNELIGDFPAAAYCALFTGEGKRAAAYLSRCVPFRDRFTAKQTAMAIWHAESAHLDRNIGSIELAALDLEAKLRDWLSVEISDTAQSSELLRLMREHRPLLNKVRERVLRWP
jgi:hypothetical protein